MLFCILTANAQIAYVKPEKISYEFIYGTKFTHYFDNNNYEFTVIMKMKQKNTFDARYWYR